MHYSGKQWRLATQSVLWGEKLPEQDEKKMISEVDSWPKMLDQACIQKKKKKGALGKSSKSSIGGAF